MLKTVINALFNGRKPRDEARQQLHTEEKTNEEPPEKSSPFDTYTPEQVDKFNARADELRLAHHKDNYRPQPKGYSVDDLVKEIEQEKASEKSVAD